MVEMKRGTHGGPRQYCTLVSIHWFVHWGSGAVSSGLVPTF